MGHLIQELRHLTGSRKPAVASTSNMQRPPAQTEWMILCLDHKHPPLMTLHHLQFSMRPSNTELFQRLSEEYEQRREPSTLWTIEIQQFWRTVKAIHFVRFTTLSPQPTATAQIEDMHSLPHEAYTWVWNRRNGINASTMARYLQEPASIGEGWSVYGYIPKTHCPLSKAGLEGWGLYVEEGMSRRSKLICLIVVLTIAYLWEVWKFIQTKAVLGIIVAGVSIYYAGGIVAPALMLDWSSSCILQSGMRL